jgi:hypothetical protein
LKVGIVADSHDNLTNIAATVREFRDRGVELLVHAGDFVAPFAVKEFLKSGLPIVAVFGNCDGEHKAIRSLLPDVATGARRENIAGRQFLIVHSIDWLDPADRGGADVIVCGHTHCPEVRGEKPLVVNPGECGGWVTGKATAAVLDTETLETEFVECKA